MYACASHKPLNKFTLCCEMSMASKLKMGIFGRGLIIVITNKITTNEIKIGFYNIGMLLEEN